MSVRSCLPGQQGIAAMPAEPPEGRKVKSGLVGAVEATDRHERAKDYLSPAEMVRLLDAAKAGRHGVRDHLIWALKSSVTSSRDALSRCKRVVDRSWICPRLSPLAPMRSTAPHHLISGRDRVPDQHLACNGNGLRGGRDQSFKRHGRARGRNAVTRPPRTSPRGRAMCR